MADAVDTGAPFPLPRVTIKFCTQCKWMLRAAYYAQELLSTFSTSLGEVALQPSTGGTFTVEIFHQPSRATTSSSTSASGSVGGAWGAAAASVPHAARTVLWDRKADGGFPETKELKRRVRDVIEPGRDLGHVDRDHHAGPAGGSGRAKKGDGAGAQQQQQQQQGSHDGKPQQAGPAAAAACESKEGCKDCD